MPDRQWDRGEHRDRDREWENRRSPERRDYSADRGASGWNRGPGEQDREYRAFDRERDWSAEEKDWRTRSYEPRDRDELNRSFDNRAPDYRSYDNPQYTNRDYRMRDFSQDDRYRDDQNVDWEGRRWQSSRDRESRDPRSSYENQTRDYTHGTGRANDYGGPAPQNPMRSWPERNTNRPSGRESSYSQNWGNQAFGNTGASFGGGLSESGRHFGRGPKNWQRSDDRIREDINEELTRNPDVDATEIDVAVNAGEVTLTGTVSDRHERREAEECAWRVSGVKEVHNNVRVHQTLSGKIASAFTGEKDKE